MNDSAFMILRAVSRLSPSSSRALDLASKILFSLLTFSGSSGSALLSSSVVLELPSKMFFNVDFRRDKSLMI